MDAERKDTKVKVGIIGTGTIFGAYVKGCRLFDILELAACADLDLRLAEARAAEFGVPRVCSVRELLDDPEISIVVNLTPPTAHAEVNLAIIAAGKHVHSEKPLAVTRADGQKILTAARERGVLVGCAPDTFLGGGLQTSRKVLDDGWIGQPVAAVGFFTGHGPESWHPNPDFFYQAGGGPLFDLGPYYLTALVHLLGPVRRVTGSARISFTERLATAGGRKRWLPVEVPTHVTGTLEFASGPVATLITSFDIWYTNLPRIEVYGSEGSLSVPDPNLFYGPVRVRRAGAEEWREVPLTHSDKVSRGIGVAEVAYALTYGRPQRASGDLAYHVLDIMHALDEAAHKGLRIEVESRCARPAPLPLGLPEGELDC